MNLNENGVGNTGFCYLSKLKNLKRLEIGDEKKHPFKTNRAYKIPLNIKKL